MTSAILNTMEWVWRTAVRRGGGGGGDTDHRRCPAQQQEPQLCQDGPRRMYSARNLSVEGTSRISPRPRQCEEARHTRSILASSPAVRLSSPFSSTTTATLPQSDRGVDRRALNDVWGVYDAALLPSSISRTSFPHHRRLQTSKNKEKRSSISGDGGGASADDGIRAVSDSCGGRRDTAQRFTEVFRNWGSESSERTVCLLPTFSNKLGRCGSVESSHDCSPHTQPLLPVSEEDMRRRVMSAVFSQWELPPVLGQRLERQQEEEEEEEEEEDDRLHVGGGADGASMGSALFSPLTATPLIRTRSDGVVDGQSGSPAAALLPQSTMTNAMTPREWEAHQLATRIHELGALLRCPHVRDGPDGFPSHSPLLVEEPLHARGDRAKGGVAAEIDRSLLFSAHTVEDQHVRAIYEDVMETVCVAVVEGEVMKHLQLLNGAALRALDHWVVDAVLKDIANVRRDIFPSFPLFQGIRLHIMSGKAAVPTALIADDEDKLTCQVALRRGAGVGGQAQDVAVRFKNGLSLTYQQLATLDHGRWLNDQVINAYLSLICEEYNTRVQREEVVSMGTHFFAKVEQELRGWTERGSMQWPPLQANSGILRWLKRRCHILQPGVTRIVLVPVNLSQTHWALAVLNWELRTWFYYDSHIYGRAALLRGEVVLRQLLHAFSEARRILLPHAPPPPPPPPAPRGKDNTAVASFHVEDCGLVVAEPKRGGEHVSHAATGFSVSPQQENSYDCGVFVSQLAWCAVHGVATTFTQEDVTALRRIMVHELLCQRSLLRLPVTAFMAL